MDCLCAQPGSQQRAFLCLLYERRAYKDGNGIKEKNKTGGRGGEKRMPAGSVHYEYGDYQPGGKRTACLRRFGSYGVFA